jgi:hypothetical protein
VHVRHSDHFDWAIRPVFLARHHVKHTARPVVALGHDAERRAGACTEILPRIDVGAHLTREHEDAVPGAEHTRVQDVVRRTRDRVGAATEIRARKEEEQEKEEDRRCNVIIINDRQAGKQAGRQAGGRANRHVEWGGMRWQIHGQRKGLHDNGPG